METLTIRTTRRQIAKEEISFLKEDWEPIRHAFVMTFTTSLFAIFGVIIFGLAFIVSSLFALARVILKF